MEKVSSGAENFSQTGKVGVPLNPTLVNYRAKLLGPTPRTDRFNGCNIIITARNNSCEKVMSSQNCQSLHRVGVGPSPLKGHTSLFQGHTSPGPYPPPPVAHTVEEWAVRILLECFLVVKGLSLSLLKFPVNNPVT